MGAQLFDQIIMFCYYNRDSYFLCNMSLIWHDTFILVFTFIKNNT